MDAFLFFIGVEGPSRCASYLLADREPLAHSTRLRTFLLKNSPPDYFFNAKTPTVFESDGC